MLLDPHTFSYGMVCSVQFSSPFHLYIILYHTIPYHTIPFASGVNYVAPTRLADGKTSLDPLRSVQFSCLCVLIPYQAGYMPARLVTLYLSEAGSGYLSGQSPATESTMPCNTIPYPCNVTGNTSFTVALLSLLCANPHLHV